MPAVVSFATLTLDVRESGAVALLSVTLDAPSSSAITVDYEGVDGTATDGDDYGTPGDPFDGTLTFAPGQTEAFIAVPIIDQLALGADRDFIVELSNPTNATLGSADESEVTILDNKVVFLSGDLLATQHDTTGDAISLQVAATTASGTTATYSATGLPTGLTIHATTGVISGTIGARAGGVSVVQVSATGDGATATQTFLWVVDPKIVMNPLDDQRSAAGTSVNLPITAYAEGATLTFAATGLPAGLSINSATGVISGTIATAAASGTPYAVTVTATDGTNSIDRSFEWTVGSLAADQTSEEGDVVGFQVGNGGLTGTLTYEDVVLPAGLSIDTGTGWISGTIAAGAAGTYSVLLTVSDTSWNVVTQEIFWVVTSKYGLLAEQVGSTGVWRVSGSSTETWGAAVDEPMELAFQLTDRFGNQASTGAVTFVATGLPDGVWLTATATGFLLEGTPTQQGTYAVSVLGTDGVSSTTRDFLFVVAPVPRTRVVVTFPANPTGPGDLNLIAAMLTAVAAANDETQQLVLDRAGVQMLVKLQMDAQYRNNFFHGPALTILIGQYPEDFKRELALALAIKDVLPVAYLTEAEELVVEQQIPKLGDNDFTTREAASNALEPLAPKIFRQLQYLHLTSTDAEVRRRAADLIDHALTSQAEVIQILRDLPAISKLGAIFDAKAWLTNMTPSGNPFANPSGLLTLVAADVLKDLS